MRTRHPFRLLRHRIGNILFSSARGKLIRQRLRHFLFMLPYRSRYIFQVRNIRKNGLAVYQELVELFDHHGWTIFPAYGTLLGIIRDGGFIAHDYDIDLFLLDDRSWDVHSLVHGIERAGFRIHSAEIFRDDVYFIKIEKKNVLVDLFISREVGGRSRSYWFDMDSSHPLDYDTYLVPVQVDLPSLLPYTKDPVWGKIPVNAPTIVEILYGPNWQTPDKSRRIFASDAYEYLHDEQGLRLDAKAFYTWIKDRPDLASLDGQNR